ncbi:cytidine deaminase [Mergibacter septicus]|uniref:Cytidine deaminase n=1 Tax=Mergibacter septicus TaxID=221402 RepID=A0A8D4LNJ8_9PAST|nr:cytidine deaminase [Mergibacter septicus]AWX14766.1 cytidine deaminase [Mergibacter septicus]QDJ14017.1 cytidine deaminase [Mergibacter septicus]UTU48534.1 cytidine deaminase [Mergibacter septicus]WMR95837.1 cytidine deaminase [Mergibacter septicus]
MILQSFSLEQRLHLAVSQLEQQSLADKLWQILQQQQFVGRLSAPTVFQLCQQLQLTRAQLALNLLPIAACYATVPISQFRVGAVAIGESGTFYFGANQEFNQVAIQQTIHAEQSAISHAWLAGESRLSEIAVNYTPCGHCRQFMNELNSAENLLIHLPHSQNNLLHSYLPDAFGPQNLDLKSRLFDPYDNQLNTTQEVFFRDDPVFALAFNAANISYSPYSHSYCGIGIQTDDGQLFKGQYIENAAFNPSLPALQSALNFVYLSAKSNEQIKRVVMVERVGRLQQKASAEQLLSTLSTLKLEYYAV